MVEALTYLLRFSHMTATDGVKEEVRPCLVYFAVVLKSAIEEVAG